MLRNVSVASISVIVPAYNEAATIGRVIGRTIRVLQTVTSDYEIVVLDDGLRIIREYMNNLSLSGQPGAGDLFMKWVFDNQAVEDRCELVPLTQQSGDHDDFAEFPADNALAHFDRSDRKFVAVALGSNNAPEVLNAVDSDWWDFRHALSNHGIQIAFLCPGQFNGRE